MKLQYVLIPLLSLALLSTGYAEEKKVTKAHKSVEQTEAKAAAKPEAEKTEKAEPAADKAAEKPAPEAAPVAAAEADKPAENASGISKEELRALIREILQEELATLSVAQPARSAQVSKPSEPAKPGEVLAHTCAGCHGTNGTLANDAFMPLAGMPEQAFVQTMLDFRDGKRQSTLMGTVANGLTDQQIQDMAKYFVQVPVQTAEVSP